MDLRSNLREGIISAIQWAVTVFYLVFIAFAFVGWYLSATRDTFSFDGTRSFTAFFVVVSVAGFVWGRHNPGGHRNRIEVLIWLFVAGFLLSMLPYVVLPLLGLSVFDVPFFTIPLVSYGLTLLVAYGLVYGLDLQLFLPDGGEFVRER